MNQNETAGNLKSDVIGLLGAATLGVVMLSPAMTLYGVFGPAFLSAGHAAPLAFIWALLATLPTAASYALLSRDFPTSGSAAAWAARATNRGIGVWAGWIVFLYYFTNFVIQPVTLGVFLGDFLTAVHISFAGVHHVGYVAGVLLCCLWPAWIVYRGISISSKGALVFLLIESTVVVALCITVVAVAPHRGVPLNLSGFTLTASPDGTSGLFRAVIFGMLAFCGFDVVSTLAEETKMAKKLIPQATILSLFIYAILIIFGIWALTFGGDPVHLKKVAESGQMPVSDIAASFWGRGSVLVTLTAISASLGLAIATSVGASRILFSMGRSGLVHGAFSKLHPTYRVPWNALNVIFFGGLAGAVVSFVAIGAFNSYVWWGTTSTFFAMVTYMLVNFANLVLNKQKIFKSSGGFVLFGLTPIFGIAVDGFILIKSFFIELLHQDWATGKSVVVFDVACALLALVAAVVTSRRN